MRFEKDYSEHVVIDGDLTVDLRLILPSDKAHLQAGIAQLSSESQYLRFFTAKSELTSAELAYLTEVDGWDHFALIAATLPKEAGAEPQGIGVARFVRLAHEPTVAEPAIVVLDAFHGRGIGRMLMGKLADAARERGVASFRSDFLATNDAARELLKSVSEDIWFMRDEDVVTAEFPLGTGSNAAHAGAEAWDAMRQCFRLVADQTVQLRRKFSMLFDRAELLAAVEDSSKDQDPPE